MKTKTIITTALMGIDLHWYRRGFSFKTILAGVLKAMNKFEDAAPQSSNYARILLRLSNAVRRKIRGSMSVILSVKN